MSSEILVVTEWPETLPLPLVECQGVPLHPTLTSELSQGNLIKRERFKQSYVTTAVAWMFTTEQYSTFLAFYDAVLLVGASQFKLSLRYPYNSELTEWMVRFVGGYESVCHDNVWEVRAELELANPIVLADWSTRL